MVAYVIPDLDAVIAHLPGVTKAVHNKAQTFGRRAEKSLAKHRRTGAARIEVKTGSKGVDTYVSLVDKNVLSIEYGYTAKNGRHVKGLYIITKLLAGAK